MAEAEREVVLAESLKAERGIVLAESLAVLVVDAAGNLDSLGSVAGIDTEKRKYYSAEKWE